MWRRLIRVGGRGLSIAEHVNFVDHVISIFFNWRALALAFASTLASLFGISAIRDWTPLSILLTSVAVGAAVSVTYIATQLFLENRRATRALAVPKLDRLVAQIEFQADLNAVDGFKTILDRGRWSHDVRSNLLQPWSHLSREIHDHLRQGKLAAWGRPSYDLPQKRIRAEEWDIIEISFDPRTLTSSMPDDPTASAFASAWTRKNLRDRKLAYVEIYFCARQLYNFFPLTR